MKQNRGIHIHILNMISIFKTHLFVEKLRTTTLDTGESLKKRLVKIDQDLDLVDIDGSFSRIELFSLGG